MHMFGILPGRRPTPYRLLRVTMSATTIAVTAMIREIRIAAAPQLSPHCIYRSGGSGIGLPVCA